MIFRFKSYKFFSKLEKANLKRSKQIVGRVKRLSERMIRYYEKQASKCEITIDPIEPERTAEACETIRFFNLVFEKCFGFTFENVFLGFEKFLELENFFGKLNTAIR